MAPIGPLLGNAGRCWRRFHLRVLEEPVSPSGKAHALLSHCLLHLKGLLQLEDLEPVMSEPTEHDHASIVSLASLACSF
eukprot:3223741-Amphidinium_carterae.1